jgi:hypothetical protein
MFALRMDLPLGCEYLLHHSGEFGLRGLQGFVNENWKAEDWSVFGLRSLETATPRALDFLRDNRCEQLWKPMKRWISECEGKCKY